MRLTQAALVLFLLAGLMVPAGFAATSAVCYTYDEMNRLIQVSYGSWGIVTYTYDAAGNRLSRTVIPTDSDDDGIADISEDANQNHAVDFGETDPGSIDTDGDGIQDGTEMGLTLDDVGADTDTSIFQPDLDPSTTSDPLNIDTDGDGRPDGEEDKNHNGRVDPKETDPCRRITLPWLPLLLFQ